MILGGHQEGMTQDNDSAQDKKLSKEGGGETGPDPISYSAESKMQELSAGNMPKMSGEETNNCNIRIKCVVF